MGKPELAHVCLLTPRTHFGQADEVETGFNKLRAWDSFFHVRQVTEDCLLRRIRLKRPNHFLLPSAIPASLDTSHHGALIVRTVLRHLARLLRCPLLTFRFIGRLLLDGLAILRIHEDLTSNALSQ